MIRINQIVLIATFASFSWLAMQIVHECGHILAALWAKAEIIKVVLHPAVISQTDVAENSHPSIIAAAGPAFGCVIPVGVWLIGRKFRCCCVYLFRFFAGFCLVANGVYLVVGLSTVGADANDLIRHGAPKVWIVLFGLIATSAGLLLWHRQGRHFGIGVKNGVVETRAVVASSLLFVLVLVAELLFGHR